ncbi:MAG: helix-turn-helix transcriptional regulator [Bacteroidota bacterium]
MIVKKKKIVAVVEKTDTGFSAFAKDFPVYTTGKTMTELQNNILDSLNFYFEDSKKQVSFDDINLEIDLKQFFQYYRVLNAKYLAERIGMNPTLLSQYVQGRKKPSLGQTEKILDGINEIGRELSGIHLIAK